VDHVPAAHFRSARVTPRALIVPAAGLGTRLQSALPKLLVEVDGVPMIDRLVTLYKAYVGATIVVTNPASIDAVRLHLRDTPGMEVVVQERPTGMLDAIAIAGRCAAAANAASVWITWCDQVAVHPRTIARLAQLTASHPNAALVMPTVLKADPYIHLERSGAGRITRVLHRREHDTMPPVGESDMGLFALTSAAFNRLLPAYAEEVGVGAATGERNFLPFIPWVAERAEVVTFPSEYPEEATGVNTPEELNTVETYLRARGDWASMRVLSIVIPAYNEERFIATLLQRIQAVDLAALDVRAEIIVVDDGSADRTSEIVAGFPEVRLYRMPANAGKGKAVRQGMQMATGEYVIIQDADLEYDPSDYVPMLRALLDGRGNVVYGSRYLRHGRYPNQTLAAYLGGRSLSLAGWIATGTYLTDTVTAYKLFHRADLAAIDLETSGFELDHEITARILAQGKRIVEVPIAYTPRSRTEGKKIGVRDWFIALRTFWRYRRG
jgi:dolichol-phosphate mannosyltransferase